MVVIVEAGGVPYTGMHPGQMYIVEDRLGPWFALCDLPIQDIYMMYAYK